MMAAAQTIQHDFRSDTVTQPTGGMRERMMTAPLGDDVWGDDPTVNLFQETVSDKLGKEAALFMPSGTQANLAAVMAHCGRGDEYIAGQYSHSYRWEGGGAAVLGSVQPQPLPNQKDGTLALDDIKAAIKDGNDPHCAATRLLALENTFNGQILPQDYVIEATKLARDHGLSCHLDGARAFNAAVGSGTNIATLTEPFDSVSICFSKGLGAPVGSVLVGSKGLINHAVKTRKMLGGGMRQSGILAAAALYALENNVERLENDHDNARLLAAGLAEHKVLTVTPPHTNIIIVDGDRSLLDNMNAYLASNGIAAANIYSSQRWVTHMGVNRQSVEAALQCVDDFFSKR